MVEGLSVRERLLEDRVPGSVRACGDDENEEEEEEEDEESI